MDMTDKNYGTLAHVLNLAYERAAKGKGRERHGKGRAFHEQPIVTIPKLQGNFDGLAYQIMKKLGELKDFPEKERRVNELLDVIVYASAMVLYEIGDDMAAVTSIKIDSIDSASAENEITLVNGIAHYDLNSREGEFPPGTKMEQVETLVDEPQSPEQKPTKSGNPVKDLPGRKPGPVLRLVTAQYLPGVDGFDDYISLHAAPHQSDPDERVVNTLTDVAVELAKHNRNTVIMINLAPEMLTNYRATMVGELLNSEGIRVIDADNDSDTITVVYDDI